MRYLHILLIVCMTAQFVLRAAESPAPPQTQSSIEYTAPDTSLTAAQEEKVFPRIESFFNNREILLQLNQGADLLNNSLDTLMESLFYHLLDHIFYRTVTNSLFLTLSADRQVYSTEFGAYVVMDKIQYGPEYYKKIATLQGLDVFLGAKTGVNLLDIRLRTDAQRLAEAKTLSPYRYFINNWFGVLPLLEKLLPPSFNANELYDPLQQVETPFRFPMTEAAIESMPVGTIRSYSLTGGVSIPFNFLSYLHTQDKDLLSKLNIQNQLPYAVFIQGEHKINVLKRSPSVFWVAVSETERVGHSVSALLSKTYYFLKNALQPIPWNGLVTLLAPLQYEWSDALVHNYDQLYEFDIRNPIAKAAYFKAVAGDFRDAGEFQKQKDTTGVRYHFTKHRNANETLTESSRNFILFHNSRSKNVTQAEIALLEPEKVTHYLEGSGSIQDEAWNVLIGKRTIQYEFSVEMEVDKRSHEKFLTPEANYLFHNENDKYHARMYLNIQDRDMDTKDYAMYIDTLRKFSRLPITKAPIIPFFDEEKQQLHRRHLYFHSPMDPPLTTHVVETELGKFTATGTVFLSFASLTKLIQTSPEVQWTHLADAYGLQKAHPEKTYRSSRYIEWIKKGLTIPARLVNERFLWADGILEVDHIVQSLSRLRATTMPLETLHGFYDLFNLDYPHLALDGFLRIIKDPTPTKVVFTVDPKSSVDPGIRKNLLDLNQQPFTSSLPFPSLQRPSLAKEKLQAFFPTHVQELRDHPTIASLSIYMKGTEKQEIQLRIKAKNVATNQPLQVFLQIEEAGKHRVGKQILNQVVVPLLPLVEKKTKTRGDELPQQSYELWLTGPNSPLSSISYDTHMEIGGPVQIRLAISADGIAWSEKKVLGFLYRDHKLFPLE